MSYYLAIGALSAQSPSLKLLSFSNVIDFLLPVSFHSSNQLTVTPIFVTNQLRAMRMNTKSVMTASAIILALIGLALTFFPAEIAGYIESNFSKSNQITFQVLGALYFAFAMLNWMAKDSVIGGIYNRPIAIANLTHFLVGGLALIKLVFSNTALPIIIQLLAGIYALFALLFGYIFYNNPAPAKKI